MKTRPVEPQFDTQRYQEVFRNGKGKKWDVGRWRRRKIRKGEGRDESIRSTVVRGLYCMVWTM